MIRFRGFTKRFGAHEAVKGLDFDVERGEVVALLGPNGSGKTTSLKAAAGLILPSSGDVLLGERGLPASRPDARSVLSFMPQRVSFPEALSGRETLQFFGRLRRTSPDRVDTVLHFSALNGAGDRAVGTYSGGMVQRLGLAVMMLPDAPVLLLDEPTAALDQDGLDAFHDLMRRERRDGKTILFTSHQLGDVGRLADRIAVLVSGRLVASLTAAELARRLAERGVMRVTVESIGQATLERVRTLAPGASAVGDELTVPGPASLRPTVLAVLRDDHVSVRAITTQEGRLEDLYTELTKDGAS